MRPSRKALLVGGALAGAIALGACSSAIDKILGTPVYNVYITQGAPQPAPQGDSVYFTISNSGVNVAYLARCGDVPALDYQVFTNGAWVEMGPAITCPAPSTPGPIELDPGAPIVMSNVYTSSGHYRVGVSVGTTADLSNAQMSWTAGFDVP